MHELAKIAAGVSLNVTILQRVKTKSYDGLFSSLHNTADYVQGSQHRTMETRPFPLIAVLTGCRSSRKFRCEEAILQGQIYCLGHFMRVVFH